MYEDVDEDELYVEMVSIYDDGRYAIDQGEGELHLFRWSPDDDEPHEYFWRLIACGNDRWPSDVPDAARAIAAPYLQAWTM